MSTQYWADKVWIFNTVDISKCRKALCGTYMILVLDTVNDRKCLKAHTGTDRV